MVDINFLGVGIGATLTLLAVSLHYARGTGWTPTADISQEVLEKRASTVPETEFPEPMNRSIGGGQFPLAQSPVRAASLKIPIQRLMRASTLQPISLMRRLSTSRLSLKNRDRQLMSQATKRFLQLVKTRAGICLTPAGRDNVSLVLDRLPLVGTLRITSNMTTSKCSMMQNLTTDIH